MRVFSPKRMLLLCPNRKPLVVLIGILFCGCGIQDFYEHKGGVNIPSPSAIGNFVGETELGARVTTKEGARNLTPGEYLIASISYTNETCHRFFNVLEHFKQDSTLIDRVLTAAVAAGSPLLALGASKTAVAVTTSSIAFANQYNNNVADIFAFSTYKDQLMDHVFGAMNDYLLKYKIDLTKVTEISTRCDLFEGSNKVGCSKNASYLLVARSMAADYASLCSLAHMRKIVAASLLNTKTSVVGGEKGNTSGALQPTTTKTEAKKE